MILELTPDEARLMELLVTQAINALGPEIHHTWSREFRSELEKRRDKLATIRERLMSVPQTAPAAQA